MPEQVPALMQDWLAGFQQRRLDKDVSALEAYVWSHANFAPSHSYADGNGRMARLLANLLVIEKGRLPIFISSERRLDYIEALATWQLASGQIRLNQPLEGAIARLKAFQGLYKSFMTKSMICWMKFGALRKPDSDRAPAESSREQKPSAPQMHHLNRNACRTGEHSRHLPCAAL